MPAVVVGRPKSSEAMMDALKKHIIRERHKKKQEQEADAEEERQRKERERQQKQDVMTLGETREQISQLEQRLAQLKDEKHQLFLQLKKVLNEDDNRRRQLVKESNDHLMMHGYPTVATLTGHPQIFLQPNLPMTGRNPIYKVGTPHGTPHTLLPPGALKRSRSPSPPPSSYAQGYGFKTGSVPAYPQQKVDDTRRGHDYVRAVLWNKNTSPYSGSQPFYPQHSAIQPVTNASTVSYTPAPASTVYSAYSATQYTQTQSGAAAPPPREEAPKQQQQQQQQQQPPPHTVYMGQRPAQHGQGYVPAHHQPIDKKPAFAVAQEPENKYYSVAPIRPSTHVPIHGGAIPIQQPPQGAKTGGITSGYPIRAQMIPSASHPPMTTGNYQPGANQPGASTPQSVYVTQAPSGRMLYSQASGQHLPVPPGGHQPTPQARYAVPGMKREV